MEIKEDCRDWSPSEPQFHHKSPVLFRCPYSERHDQTRHVLYLQRPETAPFLLLAHIWAGKSRVAREACIAFYTNNVFQMYPHHLLAFLDHKVEFCLFKPKDSSYPSGKTFDSPLYKHLHWRAILKDVNITWIRQDDCTYEKDIADLSHALLNLLGCPNLRCVNIHLRIHWGWNMHVTAVLITARIANICKALETKLGGVLASPWSFSPASTHSTHRGLSMCMQNSGEKARKFQSTKRYDLSWIWDPPNEQVHRRVADGTATPEETIRVLIADGSGVHGEEATLLHLEAAASRIEQEIVV